MLTFRHSASSADIDDGQLRRNEKMDFSSHRHDSGACEGVGESCRGEKQLTCICLGVVKKRMHAWGQLFLEKNKMQLRG